MASPILIHTDVLIIGTGPAGAALGCFLAQNGMSNLYDADSDAPADDSTRNTRSYGEPSLEHSHDTTSALDEVSKVVTFVQCCLCLAALTLHSISMATLECFRDIGIEAEAMRTGHPETEIGPWYRFSNTVTSGELFKRFAFGTSPLKQVCYKTAVG